MRYRCVHCDKEIEVAEGQKPRCPTCMRVHGLTPLSGTASNGSGARSRALLFGVVALLALAAGTGFWLLRRAPEGPGATAPSRTESPVAAPATLASELLAHGLPAKGLERSLQASPEVEAWAKTAAGDAKGALARAQAIVKAVRARAEASAFVPWSLADVRPGEAPLQPADTLAVLQKDGARKSLYPFELAALTVAALRALDEHAVLVEVFAFPAEKRPLDASGRFGYYALGVRENEGSQLQVLDPFGGRSTPPAEADRRALSDREGLGAALALSAAHTLALDPGRALKSADAAVALAPSTATTRSARAIALLANAGSGEAERELKAAAQLRNDGPRRHNLAVLYLALGDFESAQRELMAAIEKEPEFASARVTLAGLLLGAGDQAGARKELEHAEQLDPLLSAIPMVWAQYYQVIGDSAQALASAQRGVERQPDDPQPRMLLAQLYRAAGRVDEMRGEAQRVVQLVPPEQRERVRAVLEQMLGLEALEAPGTAAPAPDAPDALDVGADSLGAGGPSLQLGRTSGKGPSLLGGDEPPASGTSRREDGAGGAPKLQLQASDTK
jgi:tetratricopeptide (TPR) repeat protein